MVVGVALIRDGRVLAAHRADGPVAGGGWEFPGGKVEPGETDEMAAERELREELGLEVRIGPALGLEQEIGDRYLFRVYVGWVLAGQPVLNEHREIRWLSPGEVDQVEWLEADRPFLNLLGEAITKES